MQNLREDMLKGQDTIKQETTEGFKEVNKRLDTIGSSVAYLEDDAPTLEEFDKLKKQVNKLEKQITSI